MMQAIGPPALLLFFSVKSEVPGLGMMEDVEKHDKEKRTKEMAILPTEKKEPGIKSSCRKVKRVL